MAPAPATRHTHAWLLMSALAMTASLTSTAAVAAAGAASEEDLLSCSSRETCCDVCGADSIRCARGPCSSSFIGVSMPTTSVGFWDVVFVFYGMVPYLVPIALALDILLPKRRSWTRIFAFLFIPTVGFVNSVIIVQGFGTCFDCSRPCGSCAVSKGMPSGHATNAIGMCLWIILETLLGVGKQWYLRKKVLVVLGSMLLFVPVPYSRVYLGDHTSLQVGIGSADGVVFGLVYFFVLRFLVAKKLDRASQWFAQGRCSITVINDFSGKSASSPTPSEGVKSPLLAHQHA